MTPTENRRGVIRRRRVLALGALVLVGVASWLVIRHVTDSVDEHGARVVDLTIASQAVGERLPVSVVLPAGVAAEPRPLLVFLHGRSGDEDSELHSQMFAALADLGQRAPIVAFPYGGDHSYWHDRADGDWGRYVVEEVIPQVAERFHADSDRVAIGGISMGGFGAYDLAIQYPGRFCAVGGHSPALWQSAEETADGAFDDAEDFARNDVVAAAQDADGPLTTQPVWLDAGDEDPFRPGDEAFATALDSVGAQLAFRTWSGGHDGDYWDSHWDSYLGFYAQSLRDCAD